MKTNVRATSRKEIPFTVERDDESGWFVAHWNAARGQGGELEENVREAVRCHFGNRNLPGQIRLR